MSQEEEPAAVAPESDVPPSPAGKSEDTGTAIFKSVLGFAATAANQASQMANKATEEIDKLSLERTGKTMAEHASFAADKAKEAGSKVMTEADKLAVAGTGNFLYVLHILVEVMYKHIACPWISVRSHDRRKYLYFDRQSESSRHSCAGES